MVEKEREKSVGIINVVVGIFIIIIGFLVIILSITLGDYMGSGGGFTPAWLDVLLWIILISGITTIIYGVKRIIQDSTL